MTPLQRILNLLPAKAPKALDSQASEQLAPDAPFPRNISGLTVMVAVVVPLVFKALQAPSVLAGAGYGLSVLVLVAGIGALFMGLQAPDQDAEDATAPRLPFKTLGAGAMGLASAVLTLLEGGNAVQAIAALIAVPLLTLVAFGRDPRKNKVLDSAADPRAEDLDGLSAQVDSRLDRVREAAAIHADGDVLPRMRLFDDAVMALLRAAAHDPERMDSLRKYFGTYLDGAVAASERFANLYTGAGTDDLVAKQKYISLLEKLAKAFSAKARDYAMAGKMTLDAQMEVLETTLTQDAPRTA